MTMRRIITSLLVSSVFVSEAFAQDDASSALQMSEPSCSMDGSRLLCSNIMSMMEDMNGHSVFISSTVSCDSSPSLFDVRQAQGCSCTAQVTTESETKICGCTVCPAGYGMNPLSVDCGDLDDPYIVDTCTKVDCNFECNGACTSGCDADPLPSECVSLCARDENLDAVEEEGASDVLIEEAVSDVPSDIPSDSPSDIQSDMPSDIPSNPPTLTPTLTSTLNQESSIPSSLSAPISDPSSSAFTSHSRTTFMVAVAIALSMF